jgi:hypothetical protein
MIPSTFELQHILFDENACNEYLLENDVFYSAMTCTSCGRPMQRSLERWSFRCSKKDCRREVSLRIHTFFYGSMLKTNAILYLGHLWLSGVSNSSAKILTGFSQHTITNFYGHFRKLVANTLDEESAVIGGENVIVEVDETKLGKTLQCGVNIRKKKI